METIQVVLKKELLRAADRAARQGRINRSALIRRALRLYLKQIELREREQTDRAGYERTPDTDGHLDDWEREAAWPED